MRHKKVGIRSSIVVYVMGVMWLIEWLSYMCTGGKRNPLTIRFWENCRKVDFFNPPPPPGEKRVHVWWLYLFSLSHPYKHIQGVIFNVKVS